MELVFRQQLLGLSFLIQLTFVLFFQPAFSQSISFSFSSATGNFCAPSTIQFFPTFSSAPISFYWQLGLDNEESEIFSPKLTFQTPGSYVVTLIALYPNKLLEVSQTISVFGPANFSIIGKEANLCKPGTVEFSTSSVLPLSGLEWDFGDGGTVQQSSGSNLSHTYGDFGQFLTTLTAMDSRGCGGTAVLPISIQRPQAVLSDSPILGCLPVSVNFKAKVATLPGDSVIEYTWDFGDGSPAVLNKQSNMQYTYNLPNTYLPKLSIVTSKGCSNLYEFPPLSFGLPPGKISLHTPKDTICASEIPVFMVKNSNSTNKFLWEISNGDSFTSADSVLHYQFNIFGSYRVKVTPLQNGCIGIVDSTNIFVRGVIASYRFNNSCTNKATFDFRNNSLGTVNSIFWDFGDGTTSTQSRPIKTYPDTGSFTIKLRVAENASGCVDSILGTIYTAKPRLVETDSFICRGHNATLTILGNYNNPRVLMNWSLLGRNINNSLDSSLTLNASTSGVFTNRVIINNGNGYCRDTLLQQTPVRVSGPISNFSIPGNNCISAPLPISNLNSSGSLVDSLIYWHWDFGNGDKSNLQFPAPVDYLASGNYTIRHLVRDSKGCQDSSFKDTKIRRLPILRVIPNFQKICLGQDVQISALHRSNLKWNIPNFTGCDTCSTITVSPTVPTIYTANVTDNYGCFRTQDLSIDVWYPFDLQPNVIRDTSICIGSKVPFDLKVSGKIINWSPIVGLSNPTSANPVATPLSTTTYTATVTDTAGCFVRTASATVQVNPFPQVDMGPDLILPYDAPFTLSPIYGPNITGFQWVPSANLSCNNCPNPSGRAFASTNFSLIATTSAGCSEAFDIKLIIDCDDKNLLMTTGFTPNGDGLNDYFYPITRGVGIVKRFVIYNRYGQIIFERRDFPPNEKFYGWDGTFGGKMQPLGSYVYIVEAECDLGDTLSKKGNITLLK